MLAEHHAATGVAAGVGTFAVASGIPQLHGVALIPWVLAVTGATAFPDIDTRHTAVTKALGPITETLGATVQAGTKHRGPTHWLLPALAVGYGMQALARVGFWPLVVVLALLIGSAVHSLGIKAVDGIAEALLGVLAAYELAPSVQASWWIGAAIAVGMITHDLGDILTDRPIRFLWPLPQRFALHLFATGHTTERRIVPTVTIMLIVALGQWRGYWQVIR